MMLSDGVPKNTLCFLGIVRQWLRVRDGVTESTQCMVCFIFLATQFTDPRPEDRSELTPYEKLPVACRVKVRRANSLC